MPEEQEYDEETPEEDKQESFAYADYSGVVTMIQTYYYRMLEMFRQYYLAAIKGRDHKPARQQIQSYVVTLIQLLKRYDSVNEKKAAEKFIKKIDEFIATKETMTFQKLKECVDIISDAHNALGLNKIEFKKRDPGKSVLLLLSY